MPRSSNASWRKRYEQHPDQARQGAAAPPGADAEKAAQGSGLAPRRLHQCAAGQPRDAPARGQLDDRRQSRGVDRGGRSEEHTSELQSLMRISYAVFCLKKKRKTLKTLKRI